MGTKNAGRAALGLPVAAALAALAALIGLFGLIGLISCGDGATEPAQAEAAKKAVTTPDAHVVKLDAPREIVTRDGAFRIEWMPVGGVVPVNEHFEVKVTLTRSDDARTPVEGAEVAMTCFMPEHGHGMLREPRAEEVGKGVYMVKGMLLHMDGFWTVSVNVNVEGLAATADDELRL